MSETIVEPEDHQLVARAQGGDRAAFDQLVRRYRRQVYRAAFALLGSVEDAMDVTQETFFRAFRAIGKFESDRPFFPWIYKIARNLGLNCLQGRGRTAFAVSLDQPGPEDQPVEVADTKANPREEYLVQEVEKHLSEALESLKPEEREIVVLRDIQHYSYKDIAAVLDIPMGTVMSRLYYARERLRKRMERFLR